MLLDTRLRFWDHYLNEITAARSALHRVRCSNWFLVGATYFGQRIYCLAQVAKPEVDEVAQMAETDH